VIVSERPPDLSEDQSARQPSLWRPGNIGQIEVRRSHAPPGPAGSIVRRLASQASRPHPICQRSQWDTTGAIGVWTHELWCTNGCDISIGILAPLYWPTWLQPA